MRLTTCLIVLSVTAPAFAADWYVDALNGNDANSGASPANAWRTITWAVAQSPQTGAQTIHVAPGTYDAALGETFPITLRPDLRVVGDQGPNATIVQGAGSGELFSASSVQSGNGWSIDRSTRLEGFKLRNAASGVRVWSNWNPVSPRIADVEIEQMSFAGVYVFAGAYPCCGTSEVEFVRVRATGCARGAYVSGMSVRPTFSDCVFSANSGPGLQISTGGTAALVFERCRIDDNGGDGFALDAINYGSITATLSDSSISGNAGEGWKAAGDVGLIVAHNAHLTRCTVANNAVGLSGVRDANQLIDSLELTDCIVFGNGDDIDFTNTDSGYTPAVAGCDIGDGDFAGSNGNFSANPLFVNAGASDWRLAFGSPCADVATLTPAAETLDVLGHARDVDGNLDTVERADIGAFEHRPLELVGTAQLGTLVQWELWGPQGAPATLYWTRIALAGAPTSTPFGELDLVASAANVYRVATAGTLTPTVLQRSIPNAAHLVGQTFAFQALVDSAAAPNGKAYSNPVQFTVTP